MTKQEYLSLCEARWTAIESVSAQKNLYDLEKEFIDTWQTLGRDVLEKCAGELPTNSRKKKSKNASGRNIDSQI